MFVCAVLLGMELITSADERRNDREEGTVLHNYLFVMLVLCCVLEALSMVLQLVNLALTYLITRIRRILLLKHRQQCVSWRAARGQCGTKMQITLVFSWLVVFVLCVCFQQFLGCFFFFFFFSSRRRHTRCREVSWARRCVQETGINAEYMGSAGGSVQFWGD
eukprot:TRINITY_DN1261_c0_g1_i2.p7 TRINITY_DN1261_c0_g1~~TRINITY_DN1261_c0_g1_i2.p7  ORF type:complete len:163 (-),score=15.63 TRINITY_DN1261_c0_g1_i2:1039-1527(-)